MYPFPNQRLSASNPNLVDAQFNRNSDQMQNFFITQYGFVREFESLMAGRTVQTSEIAAIRNGNTQII
jgi:hypothetical protein